jgi:hypothetical protein
MSLATFAANFFRQGTHESSTRLVGIGCFVLAGALTVFVVIADVAYGKHASATAVSTIAMLVVNGGAALGFRKSPETSTSIAVAVATPEATTAAATTTTQEAP